MRWGTMGESLGTQDGSQGSHVGRLPGEGTLGVDRESGSPGTSIPDKNSLTQQTCVEHLLRARPCLGPGLGNRQHKFVPWAFCSRGGRGEAKGKHHLPAASAAEEEDHRGSPGAEGPCAPGRRRSESFLPGRGLGRTAA